MDIPSPLAFTVGELVDADTMNNNSSAIDFFLSPPHCYVSRVSSVQSLATGGSGTAISFDTEVYDTDLMYSSGSPTRITIVTPGIYLLTGQIHFASNSTGLRIPIIRSNGTDSIGRHSVNATNGTTTCLQVQTAKYFDPGDYVELLAFHTAGVSINSDTTNGGCWLSALWIGV
jgi:hypothetical protein